MVFAWSRCASLVEQPEAADVAVGFGLQLRQHLGVALRAEQVCEASLRPQVLLDRLAPLDLRAPGRLAVLGLEHRKDAGLARQPGELDRVVARRAPAER